MSTSWIQALEEAPLQVVQRLQIPVHEPRQTRLPAPPGRSLSRCTSVATSQRKMNNNDEDIDIGEEDEEDQQEMDIGT